MSNIQNVNSGIRAPVDTLAALGALTTAGMVTGDLVQVNQTDDLYMLDRASTDTPDGLEVIAAADGGGNWIARLAGRWEDVLGDISQGTAAAALTYEVYRDTPLFMYFFRHGQDDSLSFKYQLPHRWDYTTAVKPHIHVVPMVNPLASQVVYFVGQYAWGVDGAEIPANASWTTFDKSYTVGTTAAFKGVLVPLVSCSPPAAARGSTILLLFLKRFGTSPTDTYTTNKAGGTISANLGLLSADVHYRLKWNGTITETP